MAVVVDADGDCDVDVGDVGDDSRYDASHDDDGDEDAADGGGGGRGGNGGG